MDEQKFDKLTRAFATATTRRTLLKLLGGATAAGVAGMAVTFRPTSAQDCPGDASPGSCCLSDADCAGLICVIQGEVGAAGICACTEDGIGEPWLGCGCIPESLGSCGDSTLICCANDPGTTPAGTCASECDAPSECSALQTSCEATDCCAEGTDCGTNGWCNACYSGTQNPCSGINEAFDADYICCTYGVTTPGAIGWCVSDAECVVAPPNTGTGSSTESSWIVPAATIGAAAALLAHKSRDEKVETEA